MISVDENFALKDVIETRRIWLNYLDDISAYGYLALTAE